MIRAGQEQAERTYHLISLTYHRPSVPGLGRSGFMLKLLTGIQNPLPTWRRRGNREQMEHTHQGFGAYLYLLYPSQHQISHLNLSRMTDAKEWKGGKDLAA